LAAGLPAHVLYETTEDWAERLHRALGVPWPCQAAALFGHLWDTIVAELTARGARVGIASYARWNDGDRAFGEAIWCLVAHLRPETVVETGVAHGLTSRVILEGLGRNDSGHLWSVDLPAVDSALHSEIGMAIPESTRSRWSYVQGTARERLPGLLGELGKIDLFIHDSLHTGRNQGFELESAWAALRPEGVAVVDDIDHSLAFRTFVDEARPRAWLAARHITGPGMPDSDGLWGMAVKDTQAPGPVSPAPGPRGRAVLACQPWAARAASMKAIEAHPHYTLLRTFVNRSTVRERRHEQIELSVVREIAFVIRGLALADGRLLQIQAWQGPEVLVFRDQIARPARPVLYDRADRYPPDVRAAADLEEVDLESARWPAPDDHFDLVVWNRDLVTVKNVISALREARRMIRPGGFLILALPNLAAAHNRLLLLAGRQPSTLHINNGDHLRGFAAPTMTRILRRDLKFDVRQVIGVGIAPVTSTALPRPLRAVSHSVIWVLQKPGNHIQPATSRGVSVERLPHGAAEQQRAVSDDRT